MRIPPRTVAIGMWVLVVIVAFVFVRTVIRDRAPERVSTAPVPTASAVATPQAAPTAIGNVTAAVKRSNRVGTELAVTLVLDTHSVDLNAYDVAREIVLVGSDGIERASVRAERSGSVHHQEVALTFPDAPTNAGLRIRNLDGVAETRVPIP